MLTVKQPQSYGYKSVHDLPTPPSTSRSSPPLIYQEYTHKALPAIPRSHSPPSQQPMSAPHRGLPPPAALTLPPQPPPTAGPPPSAHHPPPPPPPPPSLTQSHQQRDPWAQLPPPPQQWQGAEESMRNWLQATVEENKRRQEEEKTKQESLRLEQRKLEMDMLRTSLSGGIPPPMVPVVFAGMGSGILPQAALEWAQQFIQPSQPHHPQLMPPQPVSPEHHRDPQSHGQYQALPPAPGAAPPPGAYAYPGSPTRPRGQTVAGTLGRPVITGPSLSSLSTNLPQPAHTGVAPVASHPHLQQTQSAHQESHASPSIYFHHWQPPTSQASSSTRPGSPSGETPRKRKATAPPAPSPTRGESRFRSPPPFIHSSLSNASRGRRGHTRQRSDMSSYRSSESGRLRRESFGGPLRGMSPIHAPVLGSSQGPSRESGSSERSEPPKHSVSSMLSSEEPRSASQHAAPTYAGGDGSEKRQRRTPPTESKAYGGAGQPGALREDDGEGEIGR